MAYATLIGEGAGTITTGQRKLTNITAARIRPQVLDGLFYKYAGVSPIVSLIRKLGNIKEVGSEAFDHWETDFMPLNVEVDGAHTAGATNLVLTTNHGNRLVVNDLLYNIETSECVRVTAVAASSATITRAYGGTSAAAIGDNDEFKKIGMADTEGNTAPAGKSSEPTRVTHYVQTRKKAVDMSRRDLNSDLYGEDEKGRAFRDAMDNMRQEEEAHYLFSSAFSSSDPTTSYGIPGRVTTNVTNNSGVALDEQTFYTWLKTPLINNTKDQGRCILFAGSNIREALDSFGRDMIRYTPDDKLLGLASNAYQTSFGPVKILPHAMLDDNLGSGSAFGRAGGFALYLNMDKIGRAVYKGGPGGRADYRLEPDVQTPGTDGKKWQWITDAGLWVANETCHAILKGCAAL